MTLTKTTCPYCGVGCGVLATANGVIKGDPDHPANYGRLCSKGAALGETIDLDGRLLTPRIDGKNSDWDTALARTATAFSDAIRDHGPDSVAFYVSGQLLTEDYYVANKLMKGFIGAANIDTNSRLCMASSVAGHKRAFGSDTVPGTYEDLEQADLIVLVGSNLAWCHPVLHQRIAAAKQLRPQMQVINIDPRRTATSEFADLHLQIAPDGDIALFNGLLTHLAKTDHINHAYVTAHVQGFRDTLQTARQTDPADSGLSASERAAFFDIWARNKRVVTVYSQGVNQSTCGTDKVNAILNCHLATGRVGLPGMGPFSVTGQPNAMGGREVGGLANMLANHLDLGNADHQAAVQRFWNSPTICTKPGLKAVDLFDACAAGQIKALWIMSTNPAVSMPNADHVAKAIANVPFVAVSDIMARTDTGDLANVLFPATGWGEKDGTVTNSERRISRQRAFLPRPGQARPDWQILCGVASHMGWGNAFSYATPADIFREYVTLSKATEEFGRGLDLSAWIDADYQALPPRQWPTNDHRFFADGRFHHPDGRARMIAVKAADPQHHDSFVLNTGRIRDQWHTMTRTGKSSRLGAHLAEPYVEVHPLDAKNLGVADADLLELSGTTGGTATLRVLISTKVTPGTLFAPMHWTRQNSAGGWINATVSAEVDPISGQPAFKDRTVTATKFTARWYGYAASAQRLTPTTPSAAIARTATGWQAELAGTTQPLDWQDTARHILNQPTAEIAVLHDIKSGHIRMAFIEKGRISALFFASPRPVALSRTTAIGLIGTNSNSLAALAGQPAQNQPDPGATICACFHVGINTLRQSITDGARTIGDLGRTTCAGTNCGSCKPELANLIAQAKLPIAAE